MTEHSETSANTHNTAAPVKLRLISRDTLKPVTSQQEALAVAVSKRGLLVTLATPYIDGQHVMMNVEGDVAHLVEATLPSGELKLCEVLRFDRETVAGRSCFVIELAHVEAESGLRRSSVWAPFRRKSGVLIRSGEDF